MDDADGLDAAGSALSTVATDDSVGSGWVATDTAAHAILAEGDDRAVDDSGASNTPTTSDYLESPAVLTRTTSALPTRQMGSRG